MSDAVTADGRDWECSACLREMIADRDREIERLRANEAELVDDHNWRSAVTGFLSHSTDSISVGRARDIIYELRSGLLPFSVRHISMHKFYDRDSRNPPETVLVPREWLAEAYRVLREGLGADGVAAGGDDGDE
jgi:hypothetical protein